MVPLPSWPWPSWPWFFPCLTVASALGVLTYTALVIKNEKGRYLGDSGGTVHSLGPFSLRIPPWWTPLPPSSSTSTPQQLSFKHKDWQGTFTWGPKGPGTPEQNLRHVIESQHIVFDCGHDTTRTIHMDMEWIRMEGMATQGEEERLYYDACFIERDDGQLLCQARSGVLHGLREGPPFEEVLKNFI